MDHDEEVAPPPAASPSAKKGKKAKPVPVTAPLAKAVHAVADGLGAVNESISAPAGEASAPVAPVDALADLPHQISSSTNMKEARNEFKDVARSVADAVADVVAPGEPSPVQSQPTAVAPPQAAAPAAPAVRPTPPKAEVAAAPSSSSSDNSAFWKKVYQRTVFSLLMIAGFSFVLAMGPSYLILLVLLLETLVYREVTALFKIPGRTILSSRTSQSEAEDDDEALSQKDTEKEELWSKTLSWYFFAVCNFFLYGESLVYYFKHVVMVDGMFYQLARHHRFVSFMLYIFGFMAFVTNLKRRNLKHQFALFCWVHMSLMLIVLSSHFIVNNILEGIIWFWVPVSLVICNDVFAYVCGMLFGRTPLISLSPKKTKEGFFGALIITLVFSWFWAGFFQQFNYMVCPAVSLGMNVFQHPQCRVNPVFIARSSPLPAQLAKVLSSITGRAVTHVTWTPFQWHAMVMAAFASLVAPFGGFFASGFKRAFKIKDFGDSIPGHGGLTDRFDCQFIMGLFSYLYYSSLLRDNRISVAMALHLIMTQMAPEDQATLLKELSRLVSART